MRPIAMAALAGTVWSAAVASGGCGRSNTEFELGGGDGGAGGTTPSLPPPVVRATALDIVVVVDETASSEAHRELVAASMPTLVDRLTNPPCINGLGEVVDVPASPDSPCAVGVRNFVPQTDLRLGIVSSSIGTNGPACSEAAADFDPIQRRLVRFRSERPAGGSIPSYQEQGFFVWDPTGRQTPPGETDAVAFGEAIRDAVAGTRIEGCPYPSPLETAYRLLVDPAPPSAIRAEGELPVAGEVDRDLLSIRSAFLRPDSALLVVLVSDRDDCSLRYGEGAEGPATTMTFADEAGVPTRLARPRPECAANPDDPCCAPCDETPPGCPAADICATAPALSVEEDPLELRCADPKRRFGRDDRFPIERYVEAFSAPEIDIEGTAFANPLFSGGRRPDQVVVAVATGVPWQDIARNPRGLGQGLTREIDWSLVLGEPPGDPLMVSSRAPRTGIQPRLDEPLAAPSAASPSANSINGHEHALDDRLQYSCIFPRLEASLCEDAARCECGGDRIGSNPICQGDDGAYSGLQRFGRATPAPRLLRFARELGSAAVVGTVCSGTSIDPAARTFGLLPTLDQALLRFRDILVVPNET